MCFSVTRNTSILFGLASHSDKGASSSAANDNAVKSIEQRFSFLHGFRVILITWINVSHSVSMIPASIMMPVAMLSRHPHDMLQLSENNGLLGNFFVNGTFAVEAFFLISGFLLVALTIAKNLQNKVSFVPFMLLRWLRFVPPLLGIIAVQKSTSIVGRGPFFSASILNETILRGCGDRDMWKDFLFINNWFNIGDSVSKGPQSHFMSHICCPPSAFPSVGFSPWTCRSMCSHSS